MKKVFKNLPVDAGNISVLPVKKLNLDIKGREKNTIPLKKGKYLISINIDDSWNGKVSTQGYLDLKNDDLIIVGDNCYVLREEDLDTFFEKYDWGANLYGSGASVGTGGDGSFDVEVSIEKISKKPKNVYKEVLAECQKILKRVQKEEIKSDKANKIINSLTKKISYSEKISLIQSKISMFEIRKANREFEEFLKSLKNK